MKSFLYPATRGRKPISVWIHGDSGTGKTVLARFILSELGLNPSTQRAYVSCRQHNTLYKVAEALVESLRILGAEAKDTLFKLDRLERHLEGKPLVLVLDDIDQTPPRDREAIIETLCQLEQTGLICISQAKNTFYSLSRSVRTRLNPQFVECLNYSPGS